MFKCWPAERIGRAVRRASSRDGHRDRDHRRARRARARARRRDSRADRAPTRARIVDLDRRAVAAGARRADGARARVRRRRLGADAHRRGDGHARRSRCSARPASIEWGPWQVPQRVVVFARASVPAVRTRRLRRRQGVRMPDARCRVDDVHAQFEALLGETGAAGHRAPPVALMRLAVIRQRYTPFGGAERFLEDALQALLERGVADHAVHARMARRRAAAASSRASSIRSTSAACGATRASRAPCARRSRATAPTLVQSHERLACCDIFRAGDGVHAAWLDERLRATDVAARASASRINPLSSLPARRWSGGCSRARGCAR